MADTAVADMKLTVGKPVVNGPHTNTGASTTALTTLCFPISGNAACPAAQPCCSQAASTLLLGISE